MPITKHQSPKAQSSHLPISSIKYNSPPIYKSAEQLINQSKVPDKRLWENYHINKSKLQHLIHEDINHIKTANETFVYKQINTIQNTNQRLPHINQQWGILSYNNHSPEIIKI